MDTLDLNSLDRHILSKDFKMNSFKSIKTDNIEYLKDISNIFVFEKFKRILRPNGTLSIREKDKSYIDEFIMKLHSVGFKLVSLNNDIDFFELEFTV